MFSDKMKIFERNRFFFGKLLTAADFNCEQDYFNNKRRLVNRLALGSGVVCGMGVIKADDTSVIVESGLALDPGGRELLLPQPVVKKLSDIEGFKSLKSCSNQNIHSVYLCAAYSEEQTEPVHSIAKNVLLDENDGSEFNKILETCKLYIKDTEPETHPNESFDATRIYIPIFSSDGVTISLSAPRYVNTNEEFFLETEIKKGSTKQQVSINYKLELSFLTIDGKNSAEINFCEGEDEKRAAYTVRTPVRAASIIEAIATVMLKGIGVSVNGIKRSEQKEKKETIVITEDKDAAVIRAFQKRSLDDSLKSSQGLYLARITLILTPDYYVIEQVEPLPFNQTVLTPILAESLRLCHGRLLPPSNPQANLAQQADYAKPEMNCGSITVKVPEKSVKGDKLFSKAEPHFLGVGEVLVTAALSQGGESIFGGGIFDDELEWSVKTDKIRGLFTVGVKLKKPMPAGEIVFDWFAYKKEQQRFSATKRLRIFPDIYYAAPHETLSFEAKLSEGKIDANELMWSVVPDDGGRINKNGVYTASAKAGFYEIQVKSRDGSLSATAFVII